MKVDLRPEYKILPADYARGLVQAIATEESDAVKAAIDINLFKNYSDTVRKVNAFIEQHPDEKSYLLKRRKKYDLAIVSLKKKTHIKRYLKKVGKR